MTKKLKEDVDNDDWVEAMAKQIECENTSRCKEDCTCVQCKHPQNNVPDEFLSQDEVDALLKGVLPESDDPPTRTLDRVKFIEKLQHFERDLRERGKLMIEKADGIALAIDIAQFELKDTK